MRKPVLFVAAVLLTTTHVLGTVRIVDNTPRRFSFIWSMPDYDISTVRAGGAETALITSSHTNITLNEPGRPMLPGFSFHVGVPAGGSAVAEVVPLEVRTVRPQSPLRRFPENEKARRPGLRFDRPWISEAQSQKLGRFDAAYLVLRPFLYHEHGGVVRVLTRAQVTVRFSGGAPSRGGTVPSSAYYRMVRRLLLNYEVARTWVRPRPSHVLRKSKAAVFPLAGNAAAARFRIGDGHTEMNLGTIKENGVVAITGRAIRSALGSDLTTSRIALYASPRGELNRDIPTVGSLPPGLREVPLLVYDGGRVGKVDDTDTFLAYVTGGNDWHYDSTIDEYEYRVNLYDDHRTYWVVLKSSGTGRRMGAYSNSDSTGKVATHFENRLHLRRPRRMPSHNKNAEVEGTLDWVWSKLTRTNPSLSYRVDISDADTTLPAYLSVGLGASLAGDLRIRFSNTDLCTTGCYGERWYPITKWSEPVAEVSLDPPVDNETYYDVEYMELRYTQELDMSDIQALTVFSDTDTVAVEYRLTGLPAGQTVYVFRVPADTGAVSLIDSVAGGSASTYSWVDTGGIGVKYHITTAAGFADEPHLERVSLAGPGTTYDLADLTGAGNVADFLVVYYSDFRSAAKRLAAHKKNIGRFTSPRIVDIRQVYREFAGGNTDPTALRNFLFYARNMWTQGEKLDHVVLLGAGHWDYKGILSHVQVPVHMPVSLESGHDHKCVDDFFVTLGGTAPQMFVGRLPAASLDEAQTLVGKIVTTEDPDSADFGAWRQRVMLVSDDDMQASTPDPVHTLTPHHRSSERVAQIMHQQSPWMNLRKIYLYEYEANEQFEKPGALRAIVREINNGLGCVNYFGHGSYDVWADEHILSVDDLGDLHNEKRYPVVNSFSCAVGKFDDPRMVSLSEQLVLRHGGGALAAISSTREAFAKWNEDMASAFYGLFFSTDTMRTIGEAYAEAKTKVNTSSLRSYALLGDPSLKFLDPSRTVTAGVYDSEGNRLDSVKALQRITVKGSVAGPGGTGVDKSFGTKSRPAYVQIDIQNPSDSASRKDGLPDNDVHYVLPGSPVFVGKTQVTGGTFTQDILVPRNVAFGRSGVTMTVYAWQDTVLGVALDTSFIFAGTAKAKLADSTGPRISVRPIYDDTSHNSEVSFADEIVSVLPLKCEIEVFDESGIDNMGAGPDEGLTIEIPGVLAKQNVNHTFQFAEGDFRRGTAPFDLKEGQLDPGHYRMIVGAQDLLGNVSSVNLDLEIVESADLKLNHVFNYPNPMRMNETTRFFWYTSNTASEWDGVTVDVVIRLYTLSGKLIRVLRPERNGEAWDGTDQFGNRLGPNIYLYRVSARPEGGLGTTVRSPIRKLVIHPPKGR